MCIISNAITALNAPVIVTLNKTKLVGIGVTVATTVKFALTLLFLRAVAVCVNALAKLTLLPLMP